jgi:flagellar motor switch protein FliN/FliY
MAQNKRFLGTETYYSLWAQSIASAMSQFTGQELAVNPAPTTDDSGDEQLWVTFTMTDVLLGEQAFSTSRADALHLGQLFIGEPLDPNAEFTADHADAFAELFRQFAGTVALQLKGQLGKDCAVRFKDVKKPSWSAADTLTLVLKTDPAVRIVLRMDTGLLNTVSNTEILGDTAAPEPLASSESRGQDAQQARDTPQPEVIEKDSVVKNTAIKAESTRSQVNEKNLDLLLDVKLEVSIRFGRRHMLLKDILDLNSGAMVELDRRVRDPIELLLGGRVIAHGEAVIVDGNYGIRITEVISPAQRVAEIA